jgi:putative transcriptional regulator
MKHYKGQVEFMAIILRLDRVMADRKISLNDLAEKVGIANVNLSKIKTGKVSAIRFSTLNAICDILDCQPGDILEFRKDSANSEIED